MFLNKKLCQTPQFVRQLILKLFKTTRPISTSSIKDFKSKQFLDLNIFKFAAQSSEIHAKGLVMLNEIQSTTFPCGSQSYPEEPKASKYNHLPKAP